MARRLGVVPHSTNRTKATSSSSPSAAPAAYCSAVAKRRLAPFFATECPIPAVAPVMKALFAAWDALPPTMIVSINSDTSNSLSLGQVLNGRLTATEATKAARTHIPGLALADPHTSSKRIAVRLGGRTSCLRIGSQAISGPRCRRCPVLAHLL